jgi:chromosome segregation ATPase
MIRIHWLAIIFLATLALGNPSNAHDANAISAARRNLADAQSALDLAQLDFNKAHAIVAEPFEAQPQWLTAFAAEKAAREKVDAAKQAVLDKVHAGDDYTALAKAHDDAVQKLQELASDPNAPSEDFAAASKTRTDTEAQMKQMDDKALAIDPGVLDAQKKLADAQAQTDLLNKQVDDAAAQDPRCQEKKKVVDAAEQKLAQAKTALEAAQKP